MGESASRSCLRQADVRGRFGWRNFQFRGCALPASLDTSCISRFVTLAVAVYALDTERAQIVA